MTMVAKEIKAGESKFEKKKLPPVSVFFDYNTVFDVSDFHHARCL